jgi:hypothetical protein
MNTARCTIGFATVACLLLSSTSAAAEEAPSSVRTQDLRDGYSYDFEDDPLDADPHGARGDRIRVRPGAARTLLIRPRTHFIAEIFKSVEDF